MTEYEAEQFCSTFADGLESGIGYARILDILERQKFDDRIIRRLRTSLLEEGDMLAEALARQGMLDASARKLVLVAERQGSLPDTFAQLARIYRQRYKRKKKIAFSFVEPLFLSALGIALTNLLSRNIVVMVFSDNLIAQFIDWALGTAIQVALFALATGSAVIGWLNLPVDMKLRELGAAIWMRIPFISEAGRKFSISMFCRYLKESLANGMTVFDGLELAAEASQNPHILRGIDEAKTRIEEGSTLVQALRGIPSLPNKVIDQVDIGESSGRLEERLESLASDFQEQSEEAFERLRTVTTSIIRYGVVILVVGTVFFTVMGLKPGR
jgi:type II secretory pathway component PulF